MGWVRKIYDWVLHWADTPFGGIALFVLAFAESSFFPIPPDVLLIALCIGDRVKSLRFALICSVGSVLGGTVGYAIGLGAWNVVDQIFFNYVPGFTQEAFDTIQALYEKWNFWIVFAAGFTPLPYKVFTIAAGVFQVNFLMFTVASVVGRSARFFLVAGLLYLFGEKVRNFIDRWFNLLVILFTLLLIGGFVVLKLVNH